MYYGRITGALRNHANYNYNHNYNYNYIYIYNHMPCGAAPRHGPIKEKNSFFFFSRGLRPRFGGQEAAYTAAALRAFLSLRYHGR